MSGAFFSLAFTAQRAFMSQLVYSAIAVFFVTSDTLNGPVYTVVGAAMAIAGYLILKNKVPHFHPLMKLSKRDLDKHTEGKHVGHFPWGPYGAGALGDDSRFHIWLRG